MKKLIVTTILALLLAVPVIAATSDFSATTGNVTVDTVTGDGVNQTLLIFSGSSAESWTFSSGTFTVTNPGTFKVGAADSAVKSIKVKNSGGMVIACANNTTAGTSYVTLPTASAAYTVVPSTTTSCTTLCSTQTGAASYYVNDGTYTLPTCGVLTCSSPYALSAASASTSTTCNPPGVASSTGTSGSASSSATPTPTTTTTPTPTTTTIPTPTTTTTTATPASTAAKAAELIKTIVAEAATLISAKPMVLAEAMGVKVDDAAETAAEAKYTAKLVSGLKSVTAAAKDAITYFVAYGTPTTKVLGAGERAGVVSSYKKAFGKVPATSAEWSDAIKIGNGRWPSVTSAAAETSATTEFKKVYKRAPDMKQPNDNAAVTVIAYGLRPANRNLNSEKAAIKSFKAIYKHAPVSALAWDIVRSIAYSGAKR
ncbi:MAG: hypothetical protein Q7R92_01040 [bacterium]|nr:hypothetical protein [bacterium]